MHPPVLFTEPVVAYTMRVQLTSRNLQQIRRVRIRRHDMVYESKYTCCTLGHDSLEALYMSSWTQPSTWNMQHFILRALLMRSTLFINTPLTIARRQKIFRTTSAAAARGTAAADIGPRVRLCSVVLCSTDDLSGMLTKDETFGIQLLWLCAGLTSAWGPFAHWKHALLCEVRTTTDEIFGIGYCLNVSWPAA